MRLAAEFVKTVDVHKVEAPEAADDPLDLARRPTTCLRSSSYEFKKSFQEVRYETMLCCLCSLAGAKPGSTIMNGRIRPMFVTRLVAGRTNNINVEAGNAKQ
jgi:hypothetical protein